MLRRKVSWKPGALFSIPLSDGSRLGGQALGLMGAYTNVVNVALFDAEIEESFDPDPTRIFAVVSTTRDLLDSGQWEILGQHPLTVPKARWPNEQFARKDYVGAKTFGSGIVAAFANAFRCQAPWNFYKDPDYFDQLMLDPKSRPSAIIVDPSKAAPRT